MKKFIITSILAALVAAGTTVMAQNYQDEYLGLPGDNLNLYAVMKLFQESETLEGFERSLNEENSRINNLDLNGDNLIDYITVSDYVDGDVHTIVLRAALNRNENQDVAVFTVQKFGDGSVQIQLIGDEDLYGRNYIIEPIYEETPNPGYTGRSRNRQNVTLVRTTYYEVATWPVVRFIYLPSYYGWHSSWYWGYYPTYWNPWRPYYWHYYYGYHYNWYPDYYRHYRHWEYHRYTRYNDFYYNNMRAHSQNVRGRIEAGNYKETYSRPDQRRDGEELFAKTYPARERRTADNASGNSQSARSASKSTRGREVTGSRTPTMRSSTDTGSNERASTSRTKQSTGTARRSTTTEINKATTTQRQQQNTTTTRRSESTEAGKTAPVQRQQQSTGTSGRTSNTEASKSSPKQRTEQKAASGRSSSRQATPKVSSSGSRSSRDSKSASEKEKSEKSSTSKPARR
ncbi:MAG: hypothetical protein MUC93_12415 [Bacteroidales bacterium]|nr:hypothetical protein [Bacteroidales bacterium]